MAIIMRRAAMGATSPGPRPERDGLKGVAGELWRMSGLYGFHPSNDKMENEKTWKMFEGWFESFSKERLKLDREAPIPVRTLVEFLDRVKRKPVDRADLMPIEKVNELTLVWGLVLIKMGYRRLNMEDGLTDLKGEVVWLLNRFGYNLPGTRAIFNPEFSDWRRFEILWRAVRDYNCGMKLTLPVPGPSHKAAR